MAEDTTRLFAALDGTVFGRVYQNAIFIWRGDDTVVQLQPDGTAVAHLPIPVAPSAPWSVRQWVASEVLRLAGDRVEVSASPSPLAQRVWWLLEDARTVARVDAQHLAVWDGEWVTLYGPSLVATGKSFAVDGLAALAPTDVPTRLADVGGAFLKTHQGTA